MVRFVHTADWQLGMTRHFLAPEAQARFADARLCAVRAVGEVAAEHGAAFVVVCGDVFESNQVDRQVVVRALEALAACPVPVYLLPGNHDPLDAGSVYRSPTFIAHRPANVAVLDGDTVVTPCPGVELHAAPWRSKRPLVDLVARTVADLEPDPATVRVVVGHGAVDALAHGRNEDPSVIVLAAAEAAIAQGLVDFVALGDRHSLTEVGTTGRVWYAGAPEPTDYDEVLPGHVALVDVDAEQVTVTPCPVGTWRFVRYAADLDSPADVAALAAWLDDLPDKERTVVQLRLVGTLGLRDHASLSALLDHHRDLLGALETPSQHTGLAVRPDDADCDAMDLAGFAAAALRDLQDAAGADDAAPVARDALALLYRLSTGAPS
ncbi:MAG: DNA repair exonuclease [Egibacteraceae bacterium]